MVNCYLVVWKPSGDTVIVDPGDEAPRIIRRVEQLCARPIEIAITHGHGDHIGAVGDLKAHYGIRISVHSDDSAMLTDPWLNLSAPFGMNITSPSADRLLKEGDELTVGLGRLRVMETPGHSKGGVILVGDGFACVGDTIFNGSIGRTDFPGGDYHQLLEVIRQKIFTLPDATILLPGHEDFTTVQQERETNPFLL